MIAIAFIKVRWIGLDFMELRYAPRPLRLAFEAWLLIIAASLLMIYCQSPYGLSWLIGSADGQRTV